METFLFGQCPKDNTWTKAARIPKGPLHPEFDPTLVCVIKCRSCNEQFSVLAIHLRESATTPN